MVDIEGRDEHILERFDFTLEEQIDQEAFGKALNKQLTGRQKPQATTAQKDAFFDLYDLTTTQFPAKGISTTKFLRLGNPQVRFGIKGHRGLFGMQKALKFFKFGKI